MVNQFTFVARVFFLFGWVYFIFILCRFLCKFLWARASNKINSKNCCWFCIACSWVISMAAVGFTRAFQRGFLAGKLDYVPHSFDIFICW